MLVDIPAPSDHLRVDGGGASVEFLLERGLRAESLMEREESEQGAKCEGGVTTNAGRRHAGLYEE
jgi:hypothetical protein